jgi:glycosyltransferase involved in cell wall biosynthesis
MPNAILEALGLGVPCIGSRISGVIDVLRHEELLFDLLDEETLAKKLGRFLSDAQYSNDLIGLCRERKEAFVFDWKEKMFLLATEKESSHKNSIDGKQ